MIKFEIDSVNLKTKKDALEFFAKDNYLRFYKKDKLRHVTRNDKRLPKLKITDDILSLQIWFKDKYKNEHRIFLDGSITLDSITIHTITTEKENLNDSECAMHLEILQKISQISEGNLLVYIDSKAKRISNGKVENAKELLEELFLHVPKEKQEELQDVYKALLNSNKEQ